MTLSDLCTFDYVWPLTYLSYKGFFPAFGQIVRTWIVKSKNKQNNNLQVLIVDHLLIKCWILESQGALFVLKFYKC